MPKRKPDPAEGVEQGQGAGAGARERKTTSVRISADLARFISIITSTSGEEAADILDPIIRGPIERRYAELIQKLSEELKHKGK